MKYQTTMAQCQQQIDKFGCVCKQCGNTLEPIETTDNSFNPTYWSGCLECERFDNGVQPYVQKIAERMVDERNFHVYSFEDEPLKEDTDEHEYWRKGQIGGASSVVSDIIRMYQEKYENG